MSDNNVKRLDLRCSVWFTQNLQFTIKMKRLYVFCAERSETFISSPIVLWFCLGFKRSFECCYRILGFQSVIFEVAF